MHKNIREIVKAELNRLLNEELSVSSIVTTATNNISKLIINKLSQVSVKQLDNKINYKETSFVVSVFNDVVLNIFVTRYDFLTVDEYNENSKLINLGSFINIKNNTMVINFFTIKNKFDNEILYQSIQHELIHLYQQRLKGLSLLSNDIDKSLYELAISNLASTDNGLVVSYLSKIIYYSYNFEQDAFVNGLYQYLLNHDKNKTGDIDYADSPQYNSLVELKEAVNYIKQLKDNDVNLTNSLLLFKKNKQWFIKRGELSIKRYLNKIGKVITKYKQDITKEVITNGGLY